MKRIVAIIFIITFVSSAYSQNFGIDEPNPTEKLDVNGNIKSNGVVYWGDSYTRTETRPDAGLQGNAGARSGFFQTNSPSPSSHWPPGASSWWHLLDIRHSNDANNYAMQFAGSFYNQDLWFRKTAGSPTQSWSRVISSNDINMTGILNDFSGFPSGSYGFSTSGGSVLLSVSGTGYNPGGDGLIGVDIYVDGTRRGRARCYTNEAYSHKTFSSGFIVVSGLSAGSHNITFGNYSGTAFDSNDFFNVSVVEMRN